MTKKIIITPLEKTSEHFFNIVPSIEYLPEWYKKSSGMIQNTFSELNISKPLATNSTYKKCMPFFDAMTAGYIVYLTADIEIIKKPDGMPYILWRTQREIISDHNLEQWKGFPCSDEYYPHLYKWNNQFSINTPKGYSLLFQNPINRLDLPFFSLSGIVDTDSYGGPIHFPFFIKNNFSGIIEKNTPIVQIIPIKREYWKREHKKYDDDKANIFLENFLSTIKRSYKKNFWNRKEYK